MLAAVEHYPVMLPEVLREFKGFKDIPVIDGTVGRGGHFFEILRLCDILVGLDYNLDSIKLVDSRLKNLGYKSNGYLYTKPGKKVYLLNNNFASLVGLVNELKFDRPGVIFVDLGVSLYQIKQSKVGLSFMELSEELDMRVDSSRVLKANDLLNGLSEKELETLFSNLGEVRNSKSLAKKIVQYRKNKKIVTVGDFVAAGGLRKIGSKVHSATKPFMALRIAVNSEHLNLKELLESAASYIKLGTKLLVLTFHSLEQSTLKEFCKNNNFELNIKKPRHKEIQENPSSRSATLNIIKKQNEE